MSPMTPVRTRLFALLLLFGVVSAHAATARLDLRNESTLNYVFLFAGEPAGAGNLEFSAVELRDDFAGWDVDESSPALFVASGAPVTPADGRVRLRLALGATTAALQWAEVAFDGTSYAIGAAGSWYYDVDAVPRWSQDTALGAANRAYIDDFFAARLAAVPASAVPLPASVLLLLPPLALLGRRRR